MNHLDPRRAGLALLRGALVLAFGLAAAVGHAQNISDVPMAVKNNVAPNFMFMVDNSGSMSNIVAETPYNANTDYTPSGCAGGNVIAAGTSVDLRVSSGAPRIRIGSTDYRHWSLAASGSDRRCFSRNAVYGARLLADNAGSPGNYLDADYTGNYLNWYFSAADGVVSGWTTRKVLNSGSVQTRMEIAKTRIVTAIGNLPVGATPSVRTGLTTYNNGDGGRLVVGMADHTGTQTTLLNTGINGLTPSGNTPLAETLADIGRYLANGYTGNITTPAGSSVAINTFLAQNSRNSCPANATCTANDASTNSPTGTPSRPVQYWCQRSYAFLVTDGRPQGDQELSNNTHLRDYDGDCTGVNAANCAGGSPNWDRKNNRTYESAGSDYLDDVAKALFDIDLRPNLQAPDARAKKNNIRTYAIGFADSTVQNDPLLISAAAQGGGEFLNATDGAGLATALATVTASAFAKDAAAAAVAVANTQITLGNIAYASSYNSGTWYGDLVAYTMDTSTGAALGNIWSFRDNLETQSASTRLIASYTGTAGAAFTAANFAGTPTSLTAGVINYIRGDRTGEGSTYRRRTYVLGDIINAEPVVVTYGGTPVIYQGGNDGMLHVVDGRTDSSVTTRGRELWAYVPRLVHANLADLSSLSYSHRYYVDATPAVSDVSGFSFSKLLVGGLGKGGMGFYALDVSSYTAANEAAVASKVLWEFTHANMGYSFGKPLIVNTAAGWRVLVTSGYGNSNGGGYLWVLNPATGAVVSTIATGAGNASNPAGLAHLSALTNAAAGTVVRYVWGGDLLGNVWRFDIDSGTATLIAQLRDGSGTAQPVTSAPTVALVAGSGTKYVVSVGTGRYLSDDDVPGSVSATAAATQQQSIYGVFDDITVVSPTLPNIRGGNGNTCPTGGGTTDFVCQVFTFQSGPGTYAATYNAVNAATKRGWYADLPLDSRLTNGRIYTQAALSNAGTLVFTANVPTSTRCDPGGSSWLFQINMQTGGAVPTVVGGNTYHDAGYFIGNALGSRPVLIITSNGPVALVRKSDVTIYNRNINEPTSVNANWRRIYWRTVE